MRRSSTCVLVLSVAAAAGCRSASPKLAPEAPAAAVPSADPLSELSEPAGALEPPAELDPLGDAELAASLSGHQGALGKTNQYQ